MSESPPNIPGLAPRVSLPPGTPAWITPELVALTLRVWQPRYAVPLTVNDAIDMLGAVSRLLGALRPAASRSESLADSGRAV